MDKSNGRSLTPAKVRIGSASPGMRPPDGGKPSTYVIQHRVMPDGDWAIADTTPDTKITLAGQPNAKTIEYRAFARNKAGDGLPSNVVEVVL